MYFLLCPRQGIKIEDGVLHRVYILGLFCPKQGQGLKPSVAPLYPTIGQVPPPGFTQGVKCEPLKSGLVKMSMAGD